MKKIITIGIISIFLMTGLATISTEGRNIYRNKGYDGIVTVDDDRVECPDADYTHIQDAIDNSTWSGPWGISKIVVYPGTYNEDIIINKCWAVIESFDGPENTIIHGSGNNNVVTISTSWATLRGFTITNSGNSNYGIFITGPFCVIRHNVFSNNDINAYDSLSYGYGTYFGCNKWDDYSGEDSNGDNIGDEPYQIDDYNWDFYPSMVTENWPNIPPLPAFDFTSIRIGLPGRPFYCEFFTSIDIDGDYTYLKIDWGDGTNSGWLGPYSRQETVQETHIYNKRGKYTIKAFVKDSEGNEGWIYTYLEIRIGILPGSQQFSSIQQFTNNQQSSPTPQSQPGSEPSSITQPYLVGSTILLGETSK